MSGRTVETWQDSSIRQVGLRTSLYSYEAEGVNHATVVSLPFEGDWTAVPVAPAGGRHLENAAVRRSRSATTAELLLAEVLFQFLLGLSRAMVAA
jgi:hypothetical protein